MRTTLSRLAGGAALGISLMLSGAAHAAPSTVWVDDNCTVGNQQGTNTLPYCTIQQGVNAVATGGWVQVKPGTYNEDVNVNKQVRVTGPKIGQDGARAYVAANEATVNATNNGFNVTANGAEINGFTIQNAGLAGVQLGSATSGNVVKYNIIRNNTTGVNLGGSGQEVSWNGLLTNNKSGPAAGNGVYSDTGATNSKIAWNTSSGNGNSMVIFAPSSSAPSSNINISFNKSNGDCNAVNMYNTNGVLVTQNTVTNNGSVDPNVCGYAIVFSGGNTGVEASYNKLSNGTWGGILFQNLAGTNGAAVVKFNTVKNGAFHGIELRASSVTAGTQVNYNTTDNNVSNPSFGTYDTDGINVGTGNTGNTMSYNNSHGNSGHDAHDSSTGAGTAGTGNTWKYNNCLTSSPSGLCS